MKNFHHIRAIYNVSLHGRGKEEKNFYPQIFHFIREKLIGNFRSRFANSSIRIDQRICQIYASNNYLIKRYLPALIFDSVPRIRFTLIRIWQQTTERKHYGISWNCGSSKLHWWNDCFQEYYTFSCDLNNFAFHLFSSIQFYYQSWGIFIKIVKEPWTAVKMFAFERGNLHPLERLLIRPDTTSGSRDIIEQIKEV